MYRALLVEDDAPLRRIIALNLRRRGYDVAEADSVASADAALAAEAQPFDVILLDVNLPDMTGWDVLRHLPDSNLAHGPPESRARRPAVISIAAMQPVQTPLDEFQPDGVLVKPFPIDVLVRLLDRVLTRRQSAPDATRHEPAHGVQ